VTLLGAFAMLCIAAAIGWPLRGTTLWPLAIPVALAFGEAGFVQTWNLSVAVPGIPVPLGWRDVVFIALVVAWLLVRRLSPPGKPSPRLVHWDMVPLAAWLALVGISIPLAWIDGGAIKLGIALAVFAYAYVPLCFVFLWDILRRTDRATMWKMLRSLSVIVSALALLYVFHMLGLSVYDAAGVNSTYSVGDGIRRDILTFPVWACITVPFLLWSERISVVEGGMVAVQAAAVAMSMTRSVVLGFALAVLLVVVARFVVRRRPLQPLVPAAVGLAGFGVLAASVPQQVDRIVGALTSRFDELSAGVSSVSTVASRLGVGARVSNFLSGWSLWMGAGFSDAAVSQSQAGLGRLLVEDSLWSVVLLYFGIIGAVVVAGTLVVGVVAGAFAAFNRRAEPLSLAIVGTAALAWLFARTAASSEILTYYPIVCAFVLALITVEARDAWSTSPYARRLLLERDDAPTLPVWARNSTLLKAGAIAVVVGIEIVVGRAMAR
jgi:hypothetical protein